MVSSAERGSPSPGDWATAGWLDPGKCFFIQFFRNIIAPGHDKFESHCSLQAPKRSSPKEEGKKTRFPLPRSGTVSIIGAMRRL